MSPFAKATPNLVPLLLATVIMGEEETFSLAEHHRDLERHFQHLVKGLETGDPLEMRCEWLFFERELGEHLELEEKELIPKFRREHPAEAAQILREHREIRINLAELGIRFDLRSIDAGAVRGFVERLRAHARAEEEIFYRWLKTSPVADRVLPLGRQLAALSRSITAAFGSDPARASGREH